MAARAVPLRRQHPRHIEPLRSRRRHAVAALTLALLAAHPPARAKERTEKKKHAAELGFRSDHNEVQIFIDKSKDYSPVEGVEPGREPEAMHALMEKLRGLSAELLTPMERLDTLRGGYSNLADLSPIEAERNSLRRFLLDGRKQLEDQVEQFDTLGKMRAFAGVREIFGRGVTEASRQSIREATTMLFFTAEMRNFRLKLNSILDEEEKAYQQKRKEIEERRARAAARRHAAAAAAALLAVAAGAWAWRRRRPRAAKLGGIVGGSYRLERELGRGGMGLVFEATDLALQRKVAIKKLRPELRWNPKDLELFMAEAQLVAALRHPHIVEIYSIINEGSEVLLVFEFVEGEPLHAVLRRAGRLSLDTARTLMGQVGSALDFAHANGIIHGDLKPANIMLMPQGAAKVMDFGLAHHVSMAMARLAAAQSWGMSPYMAPEHELGTLSRESDLYSLGVMLYEVITGRLPFPGPDFLAQKREMRFAPPSRVAPGVAPRLDEAILRALQADPKLRFHFASEFVQALGMPGS